MKECLINCPLESAVEVIGGKWKMLILYNLKIVGTKRFNELRRMFPDATQRTLTRQLRDLEEDGLIFRKVYPQVPPKVEYSITPLGEELFPLLDGLRNWGITYEKVKGISPKDGDCITHGETSTKEIPNNPS